MRQLIVSLMFITFSAWSQPTQQQAQPPIVVQVQMPPESVWTAMLKVAIPAILAGAVGAGITLYGVSKTNKHHAAENAANRAHALDIERIKDEITAEAKSRDNRWEFRREIYVNVISATTALIIDFKKLKQDYDSNGSIPPERLKDLHSHFSDFHKFANLAPIATADSVIPSIMVLHDQIFANSPEGIDLLLGSIQGKIDGLSQLRAHFSDAARKDLWGTPGAEAKAEAATQA